MMRSLLPTVLHLGLLAKVAQCQSVHDRIGGAIFGALVGDALCLGSHYEYDAVLIKQAYGGDTDFKEGYLAPGEKMGGTTHGVGWGRRQYHPGQGKGDQTDYGQYNLLMLEYFSSGDPEVRRLDAPVNWGRLLSVWVERFTSGKWGAWVCTQTKQALEKVGQYLRSHPGVQLAQLEAQEAARLGQGLGGGSNAMGLRFLPALGVYSTEEALVQAARALMFTHAEPLAHAGNEYFARLVFRLVHRDLQLPSPSLPELVAVMRAVAADMRGSGGRFAAEQVEKGIAKFQEVRDETQPLGKEEFADDLAMTSMARLWDVGRTEPIKVGKASPTEGTMPSSIYIILRYYAQCESPAEAFERGVKANAMVGGDNASRSIAVGSVLGAIAGKQGVFANKLLRDGLNARVDCEAMLNTLPLVAAGQEEPRSRGELL